MAKEIETYISKKSTHFQLIEADRSYINNILSLQKEIVDSLPDKSWFCPISCSELMDSIGNDNVYIVLCNGELASFAILVNNRKSERNLFFTNNNIATSYKNVMTAEVIVVKPKYRGNNIQSWLFSHMTKIAQTTPNITTLSGTVCPENNYSLKNFLKNNFLIYEENLSLYGGYKRNLMVKKLKQINIDKATLKD